MFSALKYIKIYIKQSKHTLINNLKSTEFIVVILKNIYILKIHKLLLTFGYTKSYVFNMHFTYKLFINELGNLEKESQKNIKEFDFNYI